MVSKTKNSIMKKIVIKLLLIYGFSFAQDGLNLDSPFSRFQNLTTNNDIGKYGPDTIKCEENLTIYNEVDHSDFYKPNYWWDNTDIRRSIFMDGGNYIYAISEKAVTAHNVETMERTGFAELPSNNKPTFIEYSYEEAPAREEESEGSSSS